MFALKKNDMAIIILDREKDSTRIIILKWLDILLDITLVKTKVKTTRIKVGG